MGFAAADSVTSLKLIEGGVPKENLALMAIPLIPVDMILPVIVTRYTSRHRPLDVVLRSMPFRYAAKQFALLNCVVLYK